MIEENEILKTGVERLETLLAQNPQLTHIYLRRDDEVLVDVTRDQAIPTFKRHPNWTIEREQPGLTPVKTVVEPEVEQEEEVVVPPKPSEVEVDHEQEEVTQTEPVTESKSVQKRKAIQKAKK